MTQNCSNLKAAKITFNRWIHKQTVVYPTMEYYLEIKRNELSSDKTIHWKIKCILLSERSTFCTYWYILYYSNCMTLWKRKNNGDGGKISSCQESRIKKDGGMDVVGGSFRQWNYSIWQCNCRHMSLYSCHYPENVWHKEWTLM